MIGVEQYRHHIESVVSAMDRPPLMSLHTNLKSVTDRRQTAKVLHKLEDLLFIAVVATIANAGCWEEIADFGTGHVDSRL